jgi:hypothetical protein
VGLTAIDALLRRRKDHKAQELLLLADLNPAAAAIPADFLHLAGTTMAATSGGTLLMPVPGPNHPGFSTFTIDLREAHGITSSPEGGG